MTSYCASRKGQSQGARQEKSRLLGVASVAVGLCVYGYVVALLGVVALLRVYGDQWWLATLLLYGPRWIYALPLIVLVPMAFLWRRRWLWPLGLSALLIVWPIMGLNVPLGSLFASEQPKVFRVLTYNVHKWGVSAEKFSALLDEVNPDFVAIQECSPSKWDIPPRWHVKRVGTSIVVSRYPIASVNVLKRNGIVNGLYCSIDTPEGRVGFCCIDLLTPRRALSPILDRNRFIEFSKLEYARIGIDKRWDESKEVAEWLNGLPDLNILAGDFNMTVDSEIYREYWSKYNNAYSETEFGFGYTKKTRINIFRYKSRIDHILSTPESKFVPRRAWVGPDLGSDHLPLIADFSIDLTLK